MFTGASNLPNSIRSYVSHARKKSANPKVQQALDNLYKGHISASTSTAAARSTKPSYQFRTSLWGRLVVALSGSAARRERACARLNTFSVMSFTPAYSYNYNFELDQAEIKLRTIAINKFEKEFARSTVAQRNAMNGKLTLLAKAALSIPSTPEVT